jgi:hypothetical protein
MAEVRITIKIDYEWVILEPDLQKCFGCDEIMVTNTNSLYFFINNEIEDKPVLSLCNSCFDCIGKD